jgi:pimeloyl-ACP methyl ester carboxylesterase
MQKLIAKLLGAWLNVLAWIAPRQAGRQGFKLFCFPFRGKLSARHRDFLQSARLSTLMQGNETIQVYAWGTGTRKVLFLHGWQSHTYRWKNYIDSLDKGQYTAYALDAPGHGLSSGNFLTVPLYSEVIRSLIAQVGPLHTIVSHSLGGFTAIYTISLHPDLTPEKLITMAPPGEAQEFFNFYIRMLGLSNRCARLVVKRFEEEIEQSPAYFSAPAFASQLSVKGLIIHDEEDDETSVENSRAIHAAWKNSRLVVTKGKGHNLKSEEVVRETIQFISHQGESAMTASVR